MRPFRDAKVAGVAAVATGFARDYTVLTPVPRLLLRHWDVMPSTRSRVVRIAAAALLLGVLWVVVPRILARLFYDDVVWAVNGWFVQYDLTIFLHAGDAVVPRSLIGGRAADRCAMARALRVRIHA